MIRAQKEYQKSEKMGLIVRLMVQYGHIFAPKSPFVTLLNILSVVKSFLYQRHNVIARPVLNFFSNQCLPL